MSNVKKTYFSRTIEISLRRAHLIEFDVRSFSDYSVATPNYAWSLQHTCVVNQFLWSLFKTQREKMEVDWD